MKALRMVIGLLVLVVAGAGAAWWWQHRDDRVLPPGFAQANGRAEATEVDVATKRAGRIAEVLVDEGDMVQAGQVLVRMDVRETIAALARAHAELSRAEQEKRYAAAQISRFESEAKFAVQQLERSSGLVKHGSVSQELVDADRNRQRVAEAALQAARIQLIEAQAAIESAAAAVSQTQIELNDGELTAPRSGRVQYRLAEPGEVLAAGGRVLTLIDLDDTWMTVFLPEQVAGRLALGAEARVLLDAFPEHPLPATISFVADQAQFTPKSVETAEERQKLSFRVKARVAVTAAQRPYAKPGLPGVVIVRTEAHAQWPSWLTTP